MFQIPFLKQLYLKILRNANKFKNSYLQVICLNAGLSFFLLNLLDILAVGFYQLIYKSFAVFLLIYFG